MNFIISLIYLQIIFVVLLPIVCSLETILVKTLVANDDEGKLMKNYINAENWQGYVSTDNKNKKYEYRYNNAESSKYESGIYKTDQLTVNGNYSYVDKDGIAYKNSYTADKNGFVSKVMFGPMVLHQSPKDILIPFTNRKKPTLQTKGIDSVLLCSLIGGGCK